LTAPAAGQCARALCTTGLPESGYFVKPDGGDFTIDAGRLNRCVMQTSCRFRGALFRKTARLLLGDSFNISFPSSPATSF